MKTTQIFISYSHKNEIWKDKIIKFLKAGRITENYGAWQDRKIEVGSDWENEIFTAIDHARIAILPITTDFLASTYIMETEIPRLLARVKQNECHILPLLIENCPWNKHQWLNKKQMFPRDGKSLSSLSEENQNGLLTELIDTVSTILNEYKNISPTNDHKQHKTEKKYFNIPDGLYHLLDRHQQQTEMDAVLYKFPPEENSRYIWFLHGHEDQCLDEFYRFHLKDYLWKVYFEPTIKEIKIQWPMIDKSTFNIMPNIVRQLKVHVNPETFKKKASPGTFQTIATEINQNFKTPIVIKTTITSEHWQKHGEQIFKQFLQMINDWPDRSNGPVIALMCIEYFKEKPVQSKSKVWPFWKRKKPARTQLSVNDHIRECLERIQKEQSNNSGVHFYVFSELYRITRTEAQSWIDIKEVQNFLSKNDYDPVIKKIYSKKDMTLTMSELIAQIKKNL